MFIHDGARPFVDEEMVERAYECVLRDQACVVGMPVKDTIKIADQNQYAVQTPDRHMSGKCRHLRYLMQTGACCL